MNNLLFMLNILQIYHVTDFTDNKKIMVIPKCP